MKKQPPTPERQANIFQSVQFMQVMAEMIKVEFQMHMDVDFRNPAVGQHASRIKQSAEAIQTHLAPFMKNKSVDFFRNEYTPELYEIMKIFVGMPLENLQEFLEGVKAMQQEGQAA